MARLMWRFHRRIYPILINRARCRRCGDVVESPDREPAREVHCRCGRLAVNGGRGWIGRGWDSGSAEGAYDELSQSA